MEGDRWRSGGLEPLHRRPNGPQLEGGIALGAMPPPTLTPNSTVRELLGLAGTRGRGKGVQQKIIHKRFLEHSCHTRRMVIVEF